MNPDDTLFRIGEVRSVLVVCSGNICRSPMAEGLLRKRLRESGLSHIRVASAGTLMIKDHPPARDAVEACREIGVDISGFLSTPLTRSVVDDFDLSLVMTKMHLSEINDLYGADHNRVMLLGAFSSADPGMEIEDPIGMPIDYYRKTLTTLADCIEGLVVGLKPAP